MKTLYIHNILPERSSRSIIGQYYREIKLIDYNTNEKYYTYAVTRVDENLSKEQKQKAKIHNIKNWKEMISLYDQGANVFVDIRKFKIKNGYKDLINADCIPMGNEKLILQHTPKEVLQELQAV